MVSGLCIGANRLKKLLIIGAGTSFTEACSLATRGQFHFQHAEVSAADGFTFDVSQVLASFSPEDVNVFVALDARAINSARATLIGTLLNAGYTLANLIAPESHVADSVRLGTNIYVGAGCHLLEHVSVGDGAWLESAVLVDHRAAIDSYATLGIGVIVGEAGKVGRNSTLSAGSQVRSGGVVGEYCEWLLGGKVPAALPDRSFFDDTLPEGARIISTKRAHAQSRN